MRKYSSGQVHSLTTGTAGTSMLDGGIWQAATDTAGQYMIMDLGITTWVYTVVTQARKQGSTA